MDLDDAKPADPWPKYHQIYLVMRQEIREGAFGIDEPLPSEQALCQQFAASRITIRKAMERLEREGMIERFRGRGTFVKRPPEASPVQASVGGKVEDLVAMGLTTEARLVSFDYVDAAPDVASALRLPPGARVQKAVRVRSFGGSPFSLLTSYVPADIGRRFTAEELRHTPILVLLEEVGSRIVRTKQVVSARLATPAVARLLGNEAGEPLLSIKRVSFDSADRPVQLMFGLYRPDAGEAEIEVGAEIEPNFVPWGRC